jgi:HEAT repeat protein
LAALAERNDESAVVAFRAALKDEVPQVRIAALHGMAKLGSAADVPALVALAAGGTGDEQAAARLALNRAPRLDAAIAARIPMAEGRQKVELIRAAGERGSRVASDAILAAVRDTDSAVRREALRALRGIARPEQSGAILAMLIAAEEDRDELERALAVSLGRADKLNIQPVVEAFEKSRDSDTRASLLAAIALTGDKEALPVLRKALETSEASVQRAAIAGLSEWTSAEPLEELLKVARTSSDPALKTLALRGYVRLVQRPVGRPAAETAKLLGAAMSAASRPEEKKAVLAAVQRVIAPESLAIAKSAENDPAVAAEAKLAAATIERALAARGR